MKLTELAAGFYGAGGDGISNADGSPVPKRDGLGVILECPCGACGENMALQFRNPLDGGAMREPNQPSWQRTGDTLETLTLRPSVYRPKEKGGCGWHGYITNGDAASI
jgi:hypothetical protein